MDTTQKPQEETFRIHDPKEARRHVRQEESSQERPKKRTAKPAQEKSGKTAAPRKKQPQKTAGKKAWIFALFDLAIVVLCPLHRPQ